MSENISKEWLDEFNLKSPFHSVHNIMIGNENVVFELSNRQMLSLPKHDVIGKSTDDVINSLLKNFTDI